MERRRPTAGAIATMTATNKCLAESSKFPQGTIAAESCSEFRVPSLIFIPPAGATVTMTVNEQMFGER